MNREIKFRSWIKEREEFIYEFSMPSVVYKETDKNFLNQFTGLYDKNGVPIYEGDILKFDHLYNYSNEIQEVTMKEYSWGTNEFEFWEIVRRGYKFEVIGNIYENENLLKQKDGN